MRLLFDPMSALVLLGVLLLSTIVSGSDENLDGFNRIIQEAVIRLPDFETSEQIGFVTMSLTVHNLQCYDMRLGDLNGSYNMESDQRLVYNINVEDLDLKCDFDFEWNFGILRDGGSGTATLAPSSAGTRTTFVSNNFNTNPPHSSTTEACDADINIDDLEFSGGITSTVLDALQGLISIGMEREVSDRVCDELSIFSNDMVQDFLRLADEYLTNYTALGPPPSMTDASDLSVFAVDGIHSDNAQLVDLTEFSFGDSPEAGFFGDFIMEAIEEGVQYFSSTVQSDPSTSDLGINIFLRDQILEIGEDENDNIFQGQSLENNNANGNRRAFILNTPEYFSGSDPALIGGIFDPTIATGHNSFFEYNITLDRIKVYGLDSFTKFEPRLHFHNHTYQMDVAIERIDIEIYLDVDFKQSTLEDSLFVTPRGRTGTNNDLDVTENIRIDISIDDFEAFMGIILAVDQQKLGQLEFGSFMYTKTMMECLMSSFYMKPNIYGLKIAVSDISNPTLRGFLAPGIDQFASTTMEALFRMYEPTILTALPSILYTLLDDILTTYTTEPTCRNPLIKPTENMPSDNFFGTEFIDLRDLFLSRNDAIRYGASGLYPYGDVFPTVMDLLQRKLIRASSNDDSTGSLSNINSIIGPITRVLSDGETPGTLTFPGDIINYGMTLSVDDIMDAQIQLRLWDLRLENLDSIGEPLALLENVMNEPYLLNNTVSAGVIDGEPVRLSIGFGIAVNQTTRHTSASLFSNNAGDIRTNNYINNEVRITFNLQTASLILTTLVKIAKDRLGAFPVRDIMNKDCWLQIIPSRPLDEYGIAITTDDEATRKLSIQEIMASVQNLDIGLECITCTSPRMEELVDLLNTEQASEDITALVNNITAYISDLAQGHMFQTEIDRLLHKAQYMCPHNPLYNSDVEELRNTVLNYQSFEIDDSAGPGNPILNIILLITLALSVLVLAGVTILFVRSIVRRRHHKWLMTLSRQQLFILQKQQNNEKQYQDQLNMSTNSMFQSQNQIPLFIRYLVPIIIIGNIALFLSGHFSVGGQVSVIGEIAGQRITINNFYEFSMARSTIDLYNAGGVELAIIIFLFSGVWPYTKQIITLVLWFLPPSRVSVSRRGSILVWLDVLAKWSMVDIFALVVSLAAFRIQILSPNRDFLPEGFYEAHLILIPVWGLYANMLAQLISQISSHFIIHYHRRIISQATKQMIQETYQEQQSNQSIPEKLCYHSFARPHRGESDRLAVRRYMNGVLIFTAFILSLLLILGCIFPSFVLEMFGLLGVAIELGQDFEPAVSNYTVFSILNLIMDQARFLDMARDYIGLGTLSAVTTLCVLIVPLVQTCALLVQWLYPMTEKFRGRLTVFVEILQAWQYVEVYIISVAIASWQLAPISTVMLNQYCGGISNYLNTFAHYGVLDASDAQCFQMNATIGSGTYLLFVGAILLAFLNSFIMKAVTQYSRDKDTTASKLDVALSSPSQNNDKIQPSSTAISQTTSVDFETSNDTTHDNSDDAEIIKGIEPVPVLFTDRFRWFLIRVDNPKVSTRISLQFAASSRAMSPPINNINV